MMNGFWKLTWIETKIFMREPLGVVSSLGLPVVIFIVLGRSLGTGRLAVTPADQAPFNVPILAALLITVSAVLSLIAIISIYREGGILKRLRATPLSPVTILSVLSLGFVIASLIPTARFAQPIGAALLYPMIVVSGLFFPLEQLPRWLRIVALGLPTTHAVSLMQGIWDGASWSAHWVNVAVLVLVFGVCTGVSTRVFRWE